MGRKDSRWLGSVNDRDNALLNGGDIRKTIADPDRVIQTHRRFDQAYDSRGFLSEQEAKTITF